MDKNTTKIALMEYLRPLNHRNFHKIVQEEGLNRYMKKLSCLGLTQLFVYAQLMQIESYADLSLHLANESELQQMLGLDSISTAQLSRRWRDLDSSFLQAVLQQLVQEVKAKFGAARKDVYLGKINIVDASLIKLCLNLYPWAPYSKHKGAVKLHLRHVYTPEVSYPEEICLTTGNVADRKRMEGLVVREPQALNVFDRGYVDYKLFDEYTQESVRFITGLRHNADIKIIADREVDPGSAIQRDTEIWLGSNNTRYVMKNHLRLIECVDDKGNPLQICTNDFRLSAEDIREIYRKRWQIELFFKWIKQHFHVKRCYGTSRNAVYNQIWTALIAYCLSLLVQANVQHKGKLLPVIKQMRLNWKNTFESFLQALFRPPSRTSRGRQKPHAVEQDYEWICQQCEADQGPHMDSLEYGALL